MKFWGFLINFLLWTLVAQVQSKEKRASKSPAEEDTRILGSFRLHLRNKIGLFEQKLKHLAKNVKAVGRKVANKIKLKTPMLKPPTGIINRK